MYRVVLCLPFCLLMASDRRDTPASAKPTSAGAADLVKDNGAALPKAAEMEKLAQSNVLAFLENCLRRYSREVQGYTVNLIKQEKIGGKIYPKEEINVRFKEKPFSVYFDWQVGSRLAERSMYVEGENDNKLLARPKGAIARLAVGDVVYRDNDHPDAKNSGRYTLKEFGIKKGTERTIAAWKAAQEEGTLQTEYLGVKNVKEVGDRPCWVIRRICKKPEFDAIKEITIFVDTETWLQTGTVLKDEEGLLIGSYFFKDIKLNPEFKPEDFQKSALTPK